MKKPLHQFTQWLPTLLEGPNEAEFTNYLTWRRRFIYKRLSLGLGLGLLYFSGLAGLHLIQALLGLTPPEGAIFKNLVTAMSMASWLVWLQTPLGSRYQAIAFLGLSWSVTMLTNVPTPDSLVIPDLKGWTITFFAQSTIIPFRWRLHLLSQLGAYAFFFATNWATSQQWLPATISALNFLFDMGWICVMSTLVVYLYERLSQAEFQTKDKLRQEQRRSERLLLNILPPSIAERLLQQQQTIADSFAEVTVLFADIVGFTQLSTQMSPPELVNLLNQVFSCFDELAEYYGLEKIKTIGDAYMVVAGLPQHRTDHASAIAQMALAMHQALKELNAQAGYSLEIRTGIHTGPVVAGIIGLKKFAYDLWGDTVNTASRMESQGVPGEIQVSRITYECLKHQYLFEERGNILIKGKGEMTTYFLRGERRF